jgi:hypothetical protein
MLSFHHLFGAILEYEASMGGQWLPTLGAILLIVAGWLGAGGCEAVRVPSACCACRAFDGAYLLVCHGCYLLASIIQLTSGKT